MSRYRRIESKIWNDQKFRALSGDGKLIFLFLLTHPAMSSLGAMRASVPGLAAELGTLSKGFREGFQELTEKGLAECDETASFIGLPNFLRYNPPENPNVVKSWESQVDLIPECDLKHLMLQRARQCVERLGKGFAERLPEPFRNGMPNPEPKPEPKPEPEPNKNTGASRLDLEGSKISSERLQLSNVTETAENPAILTGQCGKPHSRKSKTDSVSEIPIPAALDTPQFREVWKRWAQHLKESRKALTQTSARQQLADLESMGIERAVLALSHSIASCWKRIIEPTAQISGGANVFAGLKGDDLHDVGKLIEFHKRASRGPNPVIGSTESDRLRIIAAAVHCWDRADDKLKYFNWIVSGRKWEVIRDVDEDTANRLIKEHLFGVQKPHRRNSGCRSIGDELPSLLAGLGAGL